MAAEINKNWIVNEVKTDKNCYRHWILLLEIFEKFETFMVILLSVTNDAYSRILSA